MEEVKKQGMESLFVPYEIALALKELGFESPYPIGGYQGGKVFYYENGELYYDGRPMYSSDAHSGQLLAPLYQQAFRWLLALANKDKHFTNKWTISYNEDYYSLFLGGCNMGVFEAELECLKKLIEICGTQEK
jgi:hypothetical protein